MNLAGGLSYITHHNIRYFLADDGEQVLTLDLGAARFIEPAGLAFIGSMVELHWAAQWPIRFVEPKDRDVAAYVGRLGLRRLLDQAGVSHSLPVVQHRPIDHRFIELQKLAPEAIDECTETIGAHIQAWGDDLLYSQLDDALYELALNIEEHAGRSGFVAGQYYPQPRLFRLCVADCGQGIPSTIAGAGLTEEGETDAEIVARAATTRLTSKQQNGGFGLMRIVNAATRDGRGSVRIQSGRGHVEFVEKTVRATTELHVSVPGTLISAVFAC